MILIGVKGADAYNNDTGSIGLGDFQIFMEICLTTSRLTE